MRLTFAKSGTLTDATGKTIGHYAMHILATTVASDGPPEVELTGTLSLPGGQITVQLDRRTYSPVLRQAALPQTITVPWWGGRTLRYEYA